MLAKVFYHSMTGNTRKVALAMAEALRLEAQPVSGDPGAVEADLLFLGGAVYATQDHDTEPALKAFIAGLDPRKIGKAALFCTGFSDAAAKSMRSALARKGIKVEPEAFYCRGKFALFNLGRPNKADLEHARDFALRIASGAGRRA